MKKLVREKLESSIPYTLHDAHITGIKLKKEKLILQFDNGIYKLPEDVLSPRAQLVIEDVDTDYSQVLVYKNKKKEFNGKYYSLKKFIKKYSDYDMEIYSELYGFYDILLRGVIFTENRIYDFQFDLFATGNITFKIEDEVTEEETISPIEDEALEEDYFGLDELDDLVNALDAIEEKMYKDPSIKKEEVVEPSPSWQEKVLIKNTTFDERRKIVEQSLEGDVTCAGDDVLAQMYEDYIDGKIELADINKEYMRQMGNS